MKKFLLVFLAVLFVVSCSQFSNSIKTYEDEVKPRAKLLFELYFGVDENGNYLTEPQPDAVDNRQGIQDLIAGRFEKFSDNEKDKLVQADRKMVEMLGKAKSVNDKLQKFDASSEKVLRALGEVLKTAGTIYVKSQVK